MRVRPRSSALLLLLSLPRSSGSSDRLWLCGGPTAAGCLKGGKRRTTKTGRRRASRRDARAAVRALRRVEERAAFMGSQQGRPPRAVPVEAPSPSGADCLRAARPVGHEPRGEARRPLPSQEHAVSKQHCGMQPASRAMRRRPSLARTIAVPAPTSSSSETARAVLLKGGGRPGKGRDVDAPPRRTLRAVPRAHRAAQRSFF